MLGQADRLWSINGQRASWRGHLGGGF